MPADADKTKLEFKKYCISATKDETAVSFVVPLSKDQYDFFSTALQMQFTIGAGIFVALDRTELDSFEIQPMQ